METTSRRLASTISCLACRSPRSMRLRQRDLALGGEQLHAADRAQVEPQRVQARLDREVDLRLARRVRRPRRASAARSKRPPPTSPGLPSAPTTSMPCSSRYACSSATCSLVTSTSSRQEAICSKVRNPRSWPSAMSGRSSSISVIGASPASSASVLVPNPSILRDVHRAPAPPASGAPTYPLCWSLVTPRVAAFAAMGFEPAVRDTRWPAERLSVNRVYHMFQLRQAPKVWPVAIRRACRTTGRMSGASPLPWRRHGRSDRHRRRPDPASDAARLPLARGRHERREGHPHRRQRLRAAVLGAASTASSTSARTRRARTCRASRRSSTTRSAR